MTDTTTVEIYTETHNKLKHLKAKGDYNSLKEVIAELVDSGETTVSGVDEARAREIAQETIRDMVAYKALEQ